LEKVSKLSTKFGKASQNDALTCEEQKKRPVVRPRAKQQASGATGLGRVTAT
jgi:hypothetical protein